MLKKIRQFVQEEIWQIRAKDLSSQRALLLNTARVILIAIKDFGKDRCTLRASALTYYTLLTIVPVLALAFGIAQGFGFEKVLQKEILYQFKGQETAINQIFVFVNIWLERTKGGLIAGIGVVLLFYYVIRILSNIEDTLNTIWHVQQNRTFVRKLTDYLALMILGPLVAIISSSVTVYITTTVRKLTETVGILEKVSPLIDTPLRLIPYALIWLLLTLIYLVMPNKRVKFIPALIGGIVAGTAYQLTQWGYINFQIVVSSINAVYGSFAALPLFLIWVQLSWTIVLFGAEISYAIQNVQLHEQKYDIARISPHFKRKLTLYIAHLIIKQFAAEEPPLNLFEIAEKLDLPRPIVQEIMDDLQRAGVVSATKKNTDREVSYQPARDTDKLTVSYLIELIEKSGGNQLNMNQSLTFLHLEEILKEIEKFGSNSDKNILIKKL